MNIRKFLWPFPYAANSLMLLYLFLKKSCRSTKALSLHQHDQTFSFPPFLPCLMSAGWGHRLLPPIHSTHILMRGEEKNRLDSVKIKNSCLTNGIKTAETALANTLTSPHTAALYTASFVSTGSKTEYDFFLPKYFGVPKQYLK